MVWKMPNHQRERGEGGKKGSSSNLFQGSVGEKGCQYFPPLPSPPRTKAQYQSREDPHPPAPQPRFACV